MKNKGFKVILNNFIFLEDTAKSFAKICKINALSLDTINEMINVIYIKSNDPLTPQVEVQTQAYVK